MQAELHDIAIHELATFYTLFASVDAIGAVQVFDDRAVIATDNLCMVAADKLALDVDLVVGTATDNNAALLEKVFADNLALVQQLKILIFAYGQHTGTIPTELALLTGLENLWLEQNLITGSITTLIGRMTSLKTLSTYLNKMSGVLPTQLGLLTDLEYLTAIKNYNRAFF